VEQQQVAFLQVQQLLVLQALPAAFPALACWQMLQLPMQIQRHSSSRHWVCPSQGCS
jgi:hypothetical protein